MRFVYQCLGVCWKEASGGYMPLQPSHHANSTLIGRFHLMNDCLQTSFRQISGISGQTLFTGEGKKRPNHKCPLACKCCTSDDPCRMSNLRSSDFDTNSFSPTSFIFLCSQRRAKTQHSSIHSGERRPSVPLGISGQTFFTGEGKKGQRGFSRRGLGHVPCGGQHRRHLLR